MAGFEIRRWAQPPHPHFARFWYAMLDECGLLGSGAVEDWEIRLNEHFRSQMQEGLLQWFVALEQERLAGTCAAFLSAGHSNILKDLTVTLAGIYVPPEYRRRGIARALTESALQWCRERKCSTVRLHASQAGRPLYAGLGFVTATEMMRLDL